ncbi:MAG: hypothetical protein IJZ00_06735 [Lachnospiraceae bacterium]|nr:hypothetical protein [Lachnospiraceae bacterium]
MRKLKKEVKELLVFLAVLFLVMAGYAVYAHMNRFVFDESLSDVIITVGEREITLKEFTYYIMQVEETGQQAALLYNEENPLEYWGLYMNEGEKAGYISDLARIAATDYCIRDYVYAAEAVRNGIRLTEEERAGVLENATYAWEHMTEKQREVTTFTREELVLVMETEALAHKYMVMLANETGHPLEAISTEYDVNGTYYEELKLQYDIVVDERVIEKLRFGHITIN